MCFQIVIQEPGLNLLMEIYTHRSKRLVAKVGNHIVYVQSQNLVQSKMLKCVEYIIKIWLESQPLPY